MAHRHKVNDDRGDSRARLDKHEQEHSDRASHQISCTASHAAIAQTSGIGPFFPLLGYMAYSLRRGRPQPNEAAKCVKRTGTKQGDGKKNGGVKCIKSMGGAVEWRLTAAWSAARPARGFPNRAPQGQVEPPLAKKIDIESVTWPTHPEGGAKHEV